MGHVDGPDTGACADVQDALGGSVEGANVQTAVEGDEELVVHDVEAFLFGFVVGEDVGAGAVGVVAAALSNVRILLKFVEQ